MRCRSVCEQQGESSLTRIAAFYQLTYAVKEIGVTNLRELTLAKIAVFAEPIINVAARTNPVSLSHPSREFGRHFLALSEVTSEPMSVVQITALVTGPTTQCWNDRHNIGMILEGKRYRRHHRNRSMHGISICGWIGNVHGCKALVRWHIITGRNRWWWWWPYFVIPGDLHKSVMVSVRN